VPSQKPRLTKLRALLPDYRQRVLAAPWPGRAGPSRRDTLLAMAEVAWRSNSDEFTASQYQLAPLAGVTQPTVSRALKWLRDEGYVELLKAARHNKDTKGSRYRLVLDHPMLGVVNAASLPEAAAAASNLNLTSVGTDNDSRMTTPLVNAESALVRGVPGVVNAESALVEGVPGKHPVWDQDSLGRKALGIWAALQRVQPATAAGLAKEAGASRNTTKKHLRKLAEHGLAAQDGDRWVRHERDLDELLAELGAGGLRQARTDRYADRSIGYQRELKRRAEREREREAPKPEPPKRPRLTRGGPQADVVAAASTAGRAQDAAAAGKRGQRVTSLPKRLAVCQGPERHEQEFSEATLGHLSCSKCKAPFGWTA